MSPLTPREAVLYGVVVLLALNHVLLRWPGFYRRRALFWSVQFLNLAAAVTIMVVGVPGLPGALSVFRWILGLLLLFKVVQHNNRLVERARAERDEAEAEARRQAVRAALRRGRARDAGDGPEEQAGG